MSIEKIALSLLSFGETGMELISSQDVEGIDFDHVGMIGNFYSNVLGAAEHSTGLFGPLPIAYRYDLLLFLYAFNAFDPNLKDERVINNKNITRASLLLFFPTSFDTIFSSQRKAFTTMIDQWAKPFLTTDIRKASIESLNSLKESLSTHLISVTKKLDINNSKLSSIIKILGKNFFLLETVGNIFQKDISLKFLTNSEKLDPVLKRSILYENIESLVEYSRNLKNFFFTLNKTYIEIINVNLDNKSAIHKIKNQNNGIFLFYDFYQNAANTETFLEIAKRILEYSSKTSNVTYCIETMPDTKFNIEGEEMIELLSKEQNRSISLVDLSSKSSSLELAMIEFVSKIISNYSL